MNRPPAALRVAAAESRRPPFRRVLVANRGEIALRIIRACHELGCEAVAVHSDADAGAPFVRAADAAVRIGPASPVESYLRAEVIVEAALRSGAEAVHPGYGFLSERAAFAEACRAAGLVFVGPSPETLAGLGDKLAARRAAARAGVPVVPGTLEPAPVEAAAVDGLLAEAERIGWPLLVKAAAGGGGRGMRRVESPSELPAALAAAAHEAAAAFGDGAVYLERLVSGARHVEVQLLGDTAGSVVALGERDCSVQRRHQKLVEEAPAPGLSEAQRRALHRLAVAVAREVGLVNAATAEFLWTPEGEPYFLEVNARLQVEHGVTELVTGLDLVQEQLRVAAGEPLSPAVLAAAERAATPERHAIEVRIGAEDPARDFAPVPGTITEWHEPGGPGVRVDAGVEAGSRVSGDYDPLLAKLLVVAEDRPAALDRLRRALDELRVAGIQTTLPFHRWLAGHAAFVGAELATDFVARHWQPAEARATAAREAAMLAAAARTGSHARKAVPASQAGQPAHDGRGPEDAGAGRTSGWREQGRLEATARWPR
ncbi:MAG TPA: biotin carboxylase N-terminal domain-containing protein [Candidatus Limnocylindrales bacterium]|nr:biotin carboxylase N-terminal domain-containing protein [Candidatus Limnocylindrales bacterium]